MPFRPTQRVAPGQGVGLFYKVLFAVTCLISVVCIVFLKISNIRASKAMSGELLSTSANGITPVHDGMIAKLFEYFGNVTYLMPLVLVYLGYKLFLKKQLLKQVDFFLVGIFILGCNLLILGLCSLFSALSKGSHVGAGGILGDFFNIQISHLLPGFIGTLIPIAVTFVGIFLFAAHGPIWFCDAIGNLISDLIDKARGISKKETYQEPEAMEEVDINSPSPFDAGSNSMEPEVDELYPQRVASHDPVDVKAAKEQPVKSTAPKAVDPQVKMPNPRSGLYSSSFDNFGGVPTERKLDTKRFKETPMHAGIHPQSKDLNRRIEPNFGPAPGSSLHQSKSPLFSRSNVPFTAPESSTPAYGSYADSSSSMQGRETATSGSAQVSGEVKSEGPTTYINGLAYANGKEATAPKYDYDKDTPHATDANGNVVKKSIVTRVVFSNSDESLQKTTPVEPKEEKVIYKAGADHLPPLERIGNPLIQPEVSTVITRTYAEPLQKNVQVKQDGDNVSGQFTQPEQVSTIVTKGSPLKAADDAYKATTTRSSMFPNQDVSEENVISFADLMKSDEKKGFNIGSLTSAFIPSNHDEDKLKPASGDPIKESQLTKEKFSRGINGAQVNSDNQSTDNHTQSAPIVTPAPSHYENKSSESVYPQSSDNSVLEKTPSQSEPFNHNISEVDSLKNEETDSNYSYEQSINHNINVNDLSSKDETVNTKSESAQVTNPYAQRSSFAGIGGSTGAMPNQSSQVVTHTSSGTVKIQYARATETCPKTHYDEWRPSFDLLTPSNAQDDIDLQEIEDKKETINRYMRDFSLKGSVATYVSGPVITRFDILLEPGVKSSQISSSTTDLERYLMTNKINVIPAIPGTPYLGIEVPNTKRKLINLADVVESDEFVNSNAKLPLCLGVDIVGNPVVVDLAKAPHLLIGGTTGSGKSAGVNSMLVSLLLSRSPAELRLLLVDPKTVEFSQYYGLPHLLSPIITDPETANAALTWLIKEQERRYKLLSLLHTQNIIQCNDYIREQNAQGKVVYDPMWSADMGGMPAELKPLPYIVVVIDEFADLMAASQDLPPQKRADARVARLAQKARAAGIHLVLATQTPRAQVVTGVIKANFPSKIAYTVQNAQDSRVILDENGAENLLGYGDMFVRFQAVNNNNSFRAQGPYTSNGDVHNVVQSWIDRYGEPEYVDGVTEIESEDEGSQGSSGGPGVALDALFDEVAAYAKSLKDSNGNPKALSKSEIQTAFGIGFNRANKIHRQLQKEGVIDSKGLAF